MSQDQSTASTLSPSPQEACHRALRRYHGDRFYRHLGRAVSAAVLLGQAALIMASTMHPTGWLAGMLAFLAALFVADLVNGLVHMWMDHNARYTGWSGPLVAAFHLHHLRLRYEEKALWRVYVHESGFKLWLPPTLALLMAAHLWLDFPPVVLRFSACFAVLSSVAELSHFLCHNRDAGLPRRLGRLGLLLDKGRHARHHREDNVSYAFLNGWSNPILDWVAARVYAGYKQGTDLHVAGWKEIGGQ